MTSKQQTLQFTADKLTSSPEDSHANPTQPQESDLEKKMTDTSGRTCLRQFGAFNPDGSWAKTFADLLIGRTAWSSKRCRLIWKLKGTKYKRLYFQLLASARPTEETESGLLLTPTTVMTDETPEKMRERVKRNGYQNGTKYGSLLSQVKYSGMLPTPKTFDGTAENANTGKTLIRTENGFANVDKNGVKWGPSLNDLARNQMLPTPVSSDATTGAIIGEKDTFRITSTGMPRKVNQNGVDGSVGLARLVKLGMLPTPVVSDSKGGRSTEALQASGRSEKNSLSDMYHQSGKTSQLNPPICGGDDELPTQLDGITFPKWRNASIKGYGNAVVPALVYEIFKTIEENESLQ